MGSPTSPVRARHRISGVVRGGFACRAPYLLTPGQPPPGMGYPPASPPRLPASRFGSPATGTGHPQVTRPGPAQHHRDRHRARRDGYGNINPLSIDYACRPRLRSRLTLGGQACPRNPWSFGGRDSHPSFATHACIRTRVASTAGFPRRFTRHATLPYPSPPLDRPADRPRSRGNATASAVGLSPATLSARNHSTSELLRTLSRMAASKPTSWLSGRLHILSHLAHAWGP